MEVVYFTERPYRGLSEADILSHGSYFSLPNYRFDPLLAAEDYREYHDQFVLAEQVGFDGIALNEHHGNPFCMGSVLNIEAAVLARMTERVRIIMIGNPIPAHRNPLRLAEEIAMIDLISGGRLVTGWLRGAGPEQIFNNVNPAYNRELFEEAHDFIIQAWTRPGPWRYEGRHFHYRHVNPWVLPLQKPVPPTIIPGVLSRETAAWAAERGYPYLGLGAALKPSSDLWEYYADCFAGLGYQAGPENFAHLIQVYCDETDERAAEIGRKFLYAGGNSNFAKAQFTLPAGYNSPDAIGRLSSAPQGGWLGVARDRLVEARETGTVDSGVSSHDREHRRIGQLFEKMRNDLMIVVGTPEEVIRRITIAMRALRPGMLFLLAPQGDVAHSDRRRNIRLLGEHVLPELRKEADRLGLPSMFERPLRSVPLEPGAARKPVIDLSVLEELSVIPA